MTRSLTVWKCCHVLFFFSTVPLKCCITSKLNYYGLSTWHMLTVNNKKNYQHVHILVCLFLSLSLNTSTHCDNHAFVSFHNHIHILPPDMILFWNLSPYNLDLKETDFNKLSFCYSNPMLLSFSVAVISHELLWTPTSSTLQVVNGWIPWTRAHTFPRKMSSSSASSSNGDPSIFALFSVDVLPYLKL